MAKKIKIYGRIGPSWWDEGITDTDMRNMLDEVGPNEAIDVFVNSGGGDVFHGMAIYNMLRRHGGKVTAYIDGLAASAASLIVMAADEVIMPENAWLMLHNPWSIAAGNSGKFRNMAQWFDDLRDTMLLNYERKTGMSQDDLIALLDGDDHADGTWINSTRAIELGFADKIEEIDDGETSEASKVNLAYMGLGESEFARFKSAPQHISAMASAIVKTNAKLSATNKGVQMGLDKTQVNASSKKNSGTESVDVEAIAAQAVEAERARAASIRERGAKMNLPHEVVDNIVMQNLSLDESKDLLIDAAASMQKSIHGGVIVNSHTADTNINAGSGVTVLSDAADNRRGAMASAIMMRSGNADFDDQNPYRGMTLKEMARQCVVEVGMKPSADNRELVAQAFNHHEAVVMSAGGHSKSDFPFIITDTLRTSITKGYEEASEDWDQWCDTTSLQDFRQHDLTSLNFFSDLDKLDRGEEYEYGSIGDRGETIQLGKYGKLFTVDWETVIDDNLDALTRIPVRMGRAAARVPGDLAYGVLFANKQMSDGSELFHAVNHKNLFTTPLGYDGLQELDVAISTQTVPVGANDGDESPRPTNAEPEILLVPRALKHRAIQLNKAEYQDKEFTPNTFRDQFKIISNARLDANSTSAYYMLTYYQKLASIIVGFLNGNKKPEFWQQDGFKVDGTVFKIRLCAAAAAADWRTIAMSDGTNNQ